MANSDPQAAWDNGSLIAGRYAIVRELGCGAQGRVFEVVDQIRSRQLALKILHGNETEATATRREFEALAQLEHPHILQVHDFGTLPAGTGDSAAVVWYYTAELIEGDELMHAAADGPPATLIDYAHQIAVALQYVHDKNLVHGDLKPENVLVDRDGTVRVMDFGLASVVGSPDASLRSAEGRMRGTPNYMAPEIVLGEPADAASDLYALGAMLFHVASGRPPFLHHTPSEVLRAHVEVEPPSLQTLRPDLPAGLVDIITQLLSKERDGRPESAAALADMLGDLASASGSIVPLQSGLSLSRELWSRDAELHELRTMLDRATAPSQAPGGRRAPEFAILSGERGVGKTAIVRKFLRDASLAGVRVVEAFANRVGGTPLQLIAQIVHQAAAVATRDVRDRHSWIIDRFQSSAGSDTPPPAGELVRLAVSVAELIHELAAQQSTIVYLENVDSGDQASFEILSYLARSPGTGKVVYLAEINTGDGQDRSAEIEAVMQAPSVRRIDVEPFSPDATRDFVRALVGYDDVPEELLEWAATNTGMPFFIVQALELLVRRGFLESSDAGLVCPRGIPEDTLKDGARSIVLDKFADVDASGRAILDVCAVAVDMPTFERLEATLAVLEHTGIDVRETVRGLHEQGLVVTRMGQAGTHRVGFASGLEQALYGESIDVERHRATHAALVEIHERAESPDIDQLAHHAHAAGLQRATYDYASRAAQAADSLHAHDRAHHWYGIAAQAASGPEQRFAVLEPLALAAWNVGAVDEALEHAGVALELAPSTADAGRLHSRLGDLMLDRGKLEDARTSFSAAERALDESSGAGAAARAEPLIKLARLDLLVGDLPAAETRCNDALLRLESIDPTHATPRDRAVQRDAILCRAALQMRNRELNAAIESYEEALSLAQDDPWAEALVLANLGVARWQAGNLDGAIRCFERSRDLRQELHHVKGIAQCDANLGVAHYELGHPRRALESYQRALEHYQLLGDPRREATVYFNQASACLDLGWREAAYEAGVRAVARFLAAGEDDGILRSLLVLSRACRELGATEQLEHLTARLDEWCRSRHDGTETTGEHLDDHACPSTDPFHRATHRRLAANVAIAAGDVATAVHELESAQQLFDEAQEEGDVIDNTCDLARLRPSRTTIARLRDLLNSDAATDSPLTAARIELYALTLEHGLADETEPSASLEGLSEILDVARRSECSWMRAEGLRLQASALSQRPVEQVTLLSEAVQILASAARDDERYASVIRSMPDVELPDQAPLAMEPLALRNAARDASSVDELTSALDEARTQLRVDRGSTSAPAAGTIALDDRQRQLVQFANTFVPSDDDEDGWRQIATALTAFSGARGVLVIAGVSPRHQRVYDSFETDENALAKRQRAVRRTCERSERFVHHVLGEDTTDFPELADVVDEHAPACAVLPIKASSEADCFEAGIYLEFDSTDWLPTAADGFALEIAQQAFARVALQTRQQRRDSRRLSQITRLYQLSSTPGLSLDPQRVLRLSLSAMIELTGAERGFILLGEGDDIQCRVSSDAGGQAIDDPQSEVSWSIVREAFEKGIAVKVDDALGDRHLSTQASIVDLQLRSVMCVPIRSPDTMLGVAYVDNRSRSERFTHDDLRVFDMFGPQIAQSLERAFDHAKVQESSRRKSESLSTLEECIADRTRELKHQTELALEANRMKSRFLANMSHEIRTPMNSILGFAELLSNKGELDLEQAEFLRIIQLSAEGLLDIVNDILDLSKIESGRMSIEHIEYSPLTCAKQAIQVVTPRASEKRLELDLKAAEGIPALALGDPVRIRQILLNLLGNAVKFTHEGSVTVGLEPTRLESGAAGIRFRIADTGIGIPPERRGKIFEAFSQADPSTTREYGGTGLGLAITKSLTELIGGRIELVSEPGKGTTFHVDVPVAFGGSHDSATEEPQRTRSRLGPQFDNESCDEVEVESVEEVIEASEVVDAKAGPRVLIVDDNALNLKLARYYLSELGLKNTEMAMNGVECLEALRRQPYDLVLLDMQMPILDGYKTAREIRQNPEWSDLPIVALTANAMVGDAARCLEHGCSSYLPKPFALADLARIVTDLLPDHLAPPRVRRRTSNA